MMIGLSLSVFYGVLQNTRLQSLETLSKKPDEGQGNKLGDVFHTMSVFFKHA